MNGEELWAMAEAEERKRAEDMPTEKDAIRAMARAYQRLCELGWSGIDYAPKDGSEIRAVSPGCAAEGRCVHLGAGGWFFAEGGDLWPGSPCLFKPADGVRR